MLTVSGSGATLPALTPWMQILDGKANGASKVLWQCRVLHNWSHVVRLTELLCKPAKSVPMTFTSLSGQREERRMSRIDGRMEGRISVIFTTALLPSLVTDTQTHNCFLSTDSKGKVRRSVGWGQCCTWSWYIQHDTKFRVLYHQTLTRISNASFSWYCQQYCWLSFCDISYFRKQLVNITRKWLVYDIII